jgi:pilus assembly protein CpaB
MKQQRTILVLLIAVITAGIAAYGVNNAIQRMPVRTVEVGTVPVVVAAQDIPVGTRLMSEQLRVVQWPSKTPVQGAFSDPKALLDRGVIVTLSENEPITAYKVAGPESGSGLPPVIPAGMRAMSLRVNEVVGVAGFVMPGTHVDIIVSVSQAGEGAKEPMARTVINNVLVLTAGTRYDRPTAKNGNAEPQRASVVTVAVLPEDAERIALASAQGQISLALRNPTDADPTKTQGIRMVALMRGPGAQVEIEQQPNRPVAVRKPQVIQVAAPAPPPAPSVYRVETIRAAKRAEEVVR